MASILFGSFNLIFKTTQSMGFSHACFTVRKLKFIDIYVTYYFRRRFLTKRIILSTLIICVLIIILKKPFRRKCASLFIQIRCIKNTERWYELLFIDKQVQCFTHLVFPSIHHICSWSREWTLDCLRLWWYLRGTPDIANAPDYHLGWNRVLISNILLQRKISLMVDSQTWIMLLRMKVNFR